MHLLSNTHLLHVLYGGRRIIHSFQKFYAVRDTVRSVRACEDAVTDAVRNARIVRTGCRDRQENAAGHDGAKSQGV